MGGLICLVLGLMGKSSPHCPYGNLGKRIHEKIRASYKSACQEDPELKSFDSELYDRTNKFMSSLPPREGKNEHPFLESLTQVCGYLKDLGVDMVELIIANPDDVWKNEEVKSLVDIYFEGTSKTLNFFSAVENGVKETDSILLKLRAALKKYETESAFGGSMPNKYAETLEKLDKVTNMEDPFGDDDFWKQYWSVLSDHFGYLKKIEELQAKLEKKHKNVKTLKKVAHAVFATTLLSFIALSVVSLGNASHLVGIGAKASGASYGPAGSWLNRMKSIEEALEKQMQLLGSTVVRTKVDMESMKTIKSQVEKLQSQIKSIWSKVEDAGENREEEEAMKLVMQKLTKDVDEFDVQIDTVGKKVASYIKGVIEGKECVMKHMARSVC